MGKIYGNQPRHPPGEENLTTENGCFGLAILSVLGPFASFHWLYYHHSLPGDTQHPRQRRRSIAVLGWPWLSAACVF